VAGDVQARAQRGDLAGDRAERGQGAARLQCRDGEAQFKAKVVDFVRAQNVCVGDNRAVEPADPDRWHRSLLVFAAERRRVVAPAVFFDYADRQRDRCHFAGESGGVTGAAVPPRSGR